MARAAVRAAAMAEAARVAVMAAAVTAVARVVAKAVVEMEVAAMAQARSPQTNNRTRFLSSRCS